MSIGGYTLEEKDQQRSAIYNNTVVIFEIQQTFVFSDCTYLLDGDGYNPERHESAQSSPSKLHTGGFIYFERLYKILS